MDPEPFGPELAGDRPTRIAQVVTWCREQLALGKNGPEDQFLDRFEELQPELGAELKKLRIIEAARRRAGDPAVVVSDEESDIMPPFSSAAGDTPTEDILKRKSSILPQPPEDGSSSQREKIRYFGDYELVQPIARGGMGVVWKARQVSLNRTVALKMILAGNLASQQEVQRFYAEAEAAALLEHPNIVPIYEVGQHREQHYFSMAYVQGCSLDVIVRDNVLPSRKAAEYLRHVAEAIQYAHEKGVLHRDIKPSNVLIDQKDQPRVTDFGLAKRTDSNSNLTATGQVLGTPGYMPPEQALGDQAGVGPQSDVYSLGATLYCLVTGRAPFQGENAAATLIQVIDNEPVPPSKLNPGVDRDLETIVLKCLEKQGSHRYGTARDLADELGRYLRGEPIVARPITKAARAWRWCKRNPVVAGLSTAVLVVLVLGVLISGSLAIVAQRNAQRASQNEVEAIKQRNLVAEKTAAEALHEKQAAENQKAIAEERLYDSQIVTAQREWVAGDVADLEQQLDLCSPDLRGWEHRYLLWRLTRDLLWWGQTSSSFTNVAFSPDGRRIITGGHPVNVWDYTTGQHILTIPGADGFASFSPDGKRIVSGSELETIKVWDATTGKDLLTIDEPTSTLSYVVFSPDGRRIASVLRSKPSDSGDSFGGGFGRGTTNDCKITVWDAITGKEMITLKGRTDVVEIAAFSPDGRQIVSGGVRQGEVTVWDAATGKEINTLEGPTDSVESVAFSPNGKRIITGGNQVQVWDSSSGKHLLTVKGADGSAEFSPDGKRIVSGSADKTVKVWDGDTGKEVLKLKGHAEHVKNAVFSRDGRRIATVLGLNDRTGALGGGSFGGFGQVAPNPTKSIKVWDASTGLEVLTLREDSGSVHSVAFSPDGRRVISGNQSGTFTLWDATNGELVLTSGDGHDAGVESAAFSPDGRRIVTGSSDNTVRVRDVSSGLRVLTITGANGPVAFSPNGRQIVSGAEKHLEQNGGGNNDIKVWDGVMGKEVLTLKGHKAHVNCVAFSRDGQRIVSGSDDFTLKVWDAASGRELLTLNRHNGAVNSVAFSPDGLWIASGSDDKTIGIWDAHTGHMRQALEGHTGPVTSVAFSPNGMWIVSGSRDRTIKIWAGATKGVAENLDWETGESLFTFRGHTAPVTSVAFSPEGRRVVSGSEDGELRMWEVPLEPDPRTFTVSGVSSEPKIAISRDGRRIFIEGHLLDTMTGRDLRSEECQESSSRSVTALSPDGRRLATVGEKGITVSDAVSDCPRKNKEDPTDPFGGAKVEGEVEVKVEAKNLMLTLGERGDINCLEFSPDGRRIVGGSADSTLTVWNASTGQKLLTLQGHTSNVNSVAFSPDGLRILSCSEDNTLKVWDAVTGLNLLTLGLREGNIDFRNVVSMAFSPNGQQIIACIKEIDGREKSGVILVWDTNTGQEVMRLKGRAEPGSIAFSPDGRRIISGGLDGTITFWNAATGQELLTLKGHSGAIPCVAVSPDGGRILSVHLPIANDPDVADFGQRTDYCEITVWSAIGQAASSLAGHSGEVVCVACSPHSQRIVSGSTDKTVKIWDGDTGKEVLTLEGHTGTATSVAFSPDGHRVVSGSEDKSLIVWDAASGQKLLLLKGHTGTVTSVAFSPDGHRVVSGSEDMSLIVWDAATGQQLLALKGHTGTVTSVAFSLDGQRILSGGNGRNQPGEVKVWDARTGQETLTLKGHTSGVTGVAFSPDDRQIVTGSQDKSVRVWDVATGKELLTLMGHLQTVNSVAFGSDGRRIVSGSDDGNLKVWDAASGREPLTLKGHVGIVNSVAFSADGRQVVSGGNDTTVKLWTVPIKEDGYTFEDDTCERINSVAFSPDGRRIVSGGLSRILEGELDVWDAVKGKLRLSLNHDKEVESVSFSPDSRRIVSASRNNTLKVWDSITGQELANIRGAAPPVTFTPDGRQILSGSDNRDMSLKVWDTATGRELVTIKGPNDALAFSPDGKRILLRNRDNTLDVRDVTGGQKILTLNMHNGYYKSDHYSHAQFTSDGRQIISWDRDTRYLRVWDVATGQKISALQFDNDHANTELQNVVIGPDGKRILASFFDGSAIVRDIITGKEILRTQPRQADWLVNEWLEGVGAFSPDGKRFVSAGNDGIIRVSDTTTGKELRTLRAHMGGVDWVSFSEDGRRISSVVRIKAPKSSKREIAKTIKTGIEVWDSTTGRVIATLTLPSDDMGGFWISPDGQRIAIGSEDHTLRVWDVATAESILTVKGHITAISPDGKRFATGDDNGKVTVWDSTTGHQLLVLSGAADHLIRLRFTPDGQKILAECLYGTHTVWDAVTGQQVLTIRADDHNHVIFSPDGMRVASISRAWDGKGKEWWSGYEVKLWDSATGQEVRTIKVTGDPVAYSPDCRQVACYAGGSYPNRDGRIKLLNISTGQEFVTFAYNETRRCFAFSPDGKRFVAGGDATRMWDTGSGHEIPTFRRSNPPPFGDSEHLFPTPCVAVAFSPNGRWLAIGSERIEMRDVQTDQEVGSFPGDSHCLTFSRDGKWLASVGADSKLRIWDTASVKENPKNKAKRSNPFND